MRENVYLMFAMTFVNNTTVMRPIIAITNSSQRVYSNISDSSMVRITKLQENPKYRTRLTQPNSNTLFVTIKKGHIKEDNL